MTSKVCSHSTAIALQCIVLLPHQFITTAAQTNSSHSLDKVNIRNALDCRKVQYSNATHSSNAKVMGYGIDLKIHLFLLQFCSNTQQNKTLQR